MRKIFPLLAGFALLVITSCAQHSPSAVATQEARYTSEAELPKGWPQPGPFNEVSRKKYPAYRAAFTESGGRTRSFWTLFRHIKSQDIPMTAPVEMVMKEEEGEMGMIGMGFLYQDLSVGELGANGKKVEVTDVPALNVLSYAWMGPNNDQWVQAARTALEAELERRNLTATSFRLFGYNSPGVPRAKRTHELQAVLAE